MEPGNGKRLWEWDGNGNGKGLVSPSNKTTSKIQSLLLQSSSKVADVGDSDMKEEKRYPGLQKRESGSRWEWNARQLKVVLNASYRPGTVLGAGEARMRNPQSDPCPEEPRV